MPMQPRPNADTSRPAPSFRFSIAHLDKQSSGLRDRATSLDSAPAPPRGVRHPCQNRRTSRVRPYESKRVPVDSFLQAAELRSRREQHRRAGTTRKNMSRRIGMNPLRNVFALITFALTTALGATAGAQSWPSKTVRLIAVFPPGGSVDQVARVLAQQMSVQTGQTFIVENRGGASGSIGTAAIAKSEPDGYTLGVVFDTHAVNPALIPNLPFDTLKDLTPLMLVGTGGMAIVANAAQPYTSFKELVAAAKANPGTVAYGTIGAGSIGHLTMTQLGNQLGI